MVQCIFVTVGLFCLQSSMSVSGVKLSVTCGANHNLNSNLSCSAGWVEIVTTFIHTLVNLTNIFVYELILQHSSYFLPFSIRLSFLLLFLC